MNYAQSINNQASNYAGSMEPAAQPLMNQSVEQLQKSITELGASVEWLPQKIQPVCQPQPPIPGGSAEKVRAVEAPPSSLRADILIAKANVERISQSIAGVRYLIEV